LFKFIAKAYSANSQLARNLFPALLLVSGISFTATATTLTITDNLVLRDVDDKAVDTGFFSRKNTINLAQGSHTLVLKYKDVFEDLDMGEESLIKSDYFVVKFLIKEQQALILSTTKIRDLAAAERFSRSPELILLDEAKQEVVLELQKLSDYELAKQVTQVVSKLSVPVLEAQNNSHVSSVSNASNTNKDEQIFNKKVINNIDAVPMLKYWWQKATQEEKAHFLHFINESKSEQYE